MTINITARDLTNEVNFNIDNSATVRQAIREAENAGVTLSLPLQLGPAVINEGALDRTLASYGYDGEVRDRATLIYAAPKNNA